MGSQEIIPRTIEPKRIKKKKVVKEQDAIINQPERVIMQEGVYE
jgi:hypothetical protein